MDVTLYPGRMGNCRRALQMIMEQVNDVDKAIEFAKEQDDAELWEDLISYSINQPGIIQPSSLCYCLLAVSLCDDFSPCSFRIYHRPP